MFSSAETQAAEVDAMISRAAEPLFEAGGFQPVGRRKWVRSFAPIRHVFEVAALKGATLVPRWGISLDFVPHLRGGSLAWHRTDKSALLDLVYDPLDLYPSSVNSPSISSLQGSWAVQRDVERTLSAAVPRARAWLEGVNDVPRALERAEWLRAAYRSTRRFGFDNYVQQPLAYAFLLARTGSRDEGLAVLEAWIDQGEHQRLRDKLVALLNA